MTIIQSTHDKFKTCEAYMHTVTLLETERANPHPLGVINCKTRHFLHCIIFELLIKILYEIENGKEYKDKNGKYSHDISQIYQKLDIKHREEIERIYSVESKKIYNYDYRIPINRVETLEEALEGNREIVTKYKYGSKAPNIPSVISSIIFFRSKTRDFSGKIRDFTMTNIPIEIDYPKKSTCSEFNILLLGYCQKLAGKFVSIDRLRLIKENNGEIVSIDELRSIKENNEEIIRIP